MQTIRVRAWNTKSKEMFSPETMAEDQLTLLPTGQFINVHSADTRLSIIYPLDVMIPMLSTGLTDKNGVEIFEGDIIEYNFRRPYENNRFTGNIFFDDYMWLVDGDQEYHSINRLNEIEVIGDIYSNPELLTKEAA